MLLALDIGNTEITIGLFADADLERSWRIMTHPDRTPDEWAVLLRAPGTALGKRTEDCIRAGLVFGTADAVDGMVRRLKAEWPTRDVPRVVATGGLAPLIAKFSSEIEEVHPDLTLQGLRIAAELAGTLGR